VGFDPQSIQPPPKQQQVIMRPQRPFPLERPLPEEDRESPVPLPRMNQRRETYDQTFVGPDYGLPMPYLPPSIDHWTAESNAERIICQTWIRGEGWRCI
jgi:hypothetical protein